MPVSKCLYFPIYNPYLANSAGLSRTTCRHCSVRVSWRLPVNSTTKLTISLVKRKVWMKVWNQQKVVSVTSPFSPSLLRTVLEELSLCVRTILKNLGLFSSLILKKDNTVLAFASQLSKSCSWRTVLAISSQFSKNCFRWTVILCENSVSVCEAQLISWRIKVVRSKYATVR
jgi:hypothetical protein